MDKANKIEVERLAIAEAEAKRFLKRLAECRADGPSGFRPSRARAAMKRASLDLTRALADVRRSPYS